MARKAYSLDTLLNQVNARWPNRSMISDGWIGDAAHQAVQSEHNPNAEGVVTALDITHDPAHGADMAVLAQEILQSGDARVWYIIFNRRIWEGGVWTPYFGDNPLDKHLHISTRQEEQYYDDPAQWKLMNGGDMQVTEPLFRRLWSLVGLDIGPEGRQPTQQEVNEAVGRDVYEFLDYWGNTTPLVSERSEAALFHTVVTDLNRQIVELKQLTATDAAVKLAAIKEILG